MSGAGGGEFGNLTGMIERLNSAAMRSRSGSGGEKKSERSAAGLLRSKRCSSVDRWTPASAPGLVHPKRSVSLSPLGFATAARSPSPFHSLAAVASPPVLKRSLSLPDASLPGSGGAHVRKAPTVTPILEQLESELCAKDSAESPSAPVVPSKKRRQPSSAPLPRDCLLYTSDAADES